MQSDRFVQMVGRIRSLVPVCLLVLAAQGCQERPTTVSGAITLDGRPLTVSSSARGTVIFQPDGGRAALHGLRR